MSRWGRPFCCRSTDEAIAAILGVVALLVAALAFLADTAPGHRFIAHRIAALSPQTGLKIRIGRIETGLIYSQAEIHDLALSDPQGAAAPRIRTGHHSPGSTTSLI